MRVQWNWGYSVTTVYVAFALGTVGMVALALAQPQDLVDRDYYERSLGQDRRIEAVRNARDLGAEFSSAVANDGRSVTVVFPAGQRGRVVGRVTLYRASDASADRSTPLAPTADGTVRVPLTGLAPGTWRIEIDWTVGGRPFYFERRLDVR